MTLFQRLAAASVATVSLALVGAIGIAPAADAVTRPAQKHSVQLKTHLVKKEIHCC